MFNSFGTVTTSTISFLSTTQADKVAQKEQLKREEQELQEELDVYEENYQKVLVPDLQRFIRLV